MDTITFAYRAGDDEIVIEINGRSLRDLARAVELPEARRTRERGLAGSYAWLPGHAVGWRAEHFLGIGREPRLADGDTWVLGCQCGDWGCWPLLARIEVADSDVTWSGFRQGHRDWDLGDLGPFHFGRAAYERAVAELATGLARARP